MSETFLIEGTRARGGYFATDNVQTVFDDELRRARMIDHWRAWFEWSEAQARSSLPLHTGTRVILADP